MCGAYPLLLTFAKLVEGSPPHVRGILHSSKYGQSFSGITPACAGHISRCCNRSSCRWDHPRMCGAYTARTAQSRALLGSPPHVRGILCNALRYSGRAGITPACAGHIINAKLVQNMNRDHPRMCGAYT